MPLLAGGPKWSIAAEPLDRNSIPAWTTRKVMMDGTITTNENEVGDPFNATVIHSGEYNGARVYGQIANVEMSGRTEGSTRMVLSFTSLRMPDGRGA